MLVLGFVFGSILELFNESITNPPSVLLSTGPESWTGWTRWGATPTTLPPSESPLYPKGKRCSSRYYTTVHLGLCPSASRHPPRSWTGWTMGGGIPTILPPLDSPLYPKG